MKKILQKILVISSIILATATTISLTHPSQAYAANDCRSFLGLTSWDCGVNVKDDSQDVKTKVLKIAFNIASDITVAVAYLIIGYVIYGGYLYTMSGGDPSKVASGKKTLLHGFTGLAIVLLANVIFGIIRSVLIGSGNLTQCLEAECVNPTDLVSNTLNWVLGISGVVAVIFIVYGGISYSTSAGDPSKLKKAKDMILYSLIGLGIIGLSLIITNVVTNIIKDSAKTPGYIQQTNIILKEVHEK